MSIEQMIATVECYIHHKKNVQVRIRKPQNPHHYFLLSKAYENCIEYFIKN